jgi:hypothetical protein
VAKVVGIDHGAYRLDHSISHLKLEHGEHPALGVVADRARLPVDKGKPDIGARSPTRNVAISRYGYAMANSEDFDSRLTAVESGVAAAQAEAAVALALASSAHADVAKVKTSLNAHFRVLNALRETQVEHGRKLDRLEARFDGLEAKVDRGFAAVQQRFAEVDRNFAQVNQNFAQVERQFSIVNVGIAQITAMLTNRTDPGSPADQN